MDKNVRLIKLTNNDWFLAEVLKERDNAKIILNKPFNVVISTDGPVFIPVIELMLKENRIRVEESSIVYQEEVNKEVYNYYVQKTSNIIQPKMADFIS